MNKKNYYIKLLNYSKRLKAIRFLGGCCEKCGDDKWYHLDFHHTKEKEAEVSILLRSRWSKIEKELSKCILLCANCHREYHFNERKSKDVRQKSKSIFLNYKNNSCEDCGYDKCQASLTFHHIDSSTKEIEIANFHDRIESLEDMNELIRIELDKCILLCANCHREKHTDLNFFEANKKQILDKSFNIKELSPKVNVDLVIEMYKSGKKQVEIRKELNVAKSTISGILKKYIGSLA